MSNWTKTRSVLALTIKKNPNADTTALRRQMKAEHLEAYVAKVVASAPPLTDEQRDRVASILRGGFAPSGGE
jgi:hypothetical protein